MALQRGGLSKKKKKTTCFRIICSLTALLLAWHISFVCLFFLSFHQLISLSLPSSENPRLAFVNIPSCVESIPTTLMCFLTISRAIYGDGVYFTTLCGLWLLYCGRYAHVLGVSSLLHMSHAKLQELLLQFFTEQVCQVLFPGFDHREEELIKQEPSCPSQCVSPSGNLALVLSPVIRAWEQGHAEHRMG